MLSVLRWLFLASGIIGLLGGTVLYQRFGGPLAKRWWSYFERPDAPIPALLRDDRVLRTWALVSGTVMLLLWWWLGTEAGAAAFEALVRQAGPGQSS
jgi:hypothetical protein